MAQFDGTIITGAGVANINQDRRVVEMAETIYLLEPNAAWKWAV